MLLAAIGLRKNIPQVDGISTKTIRRIRIKSSNSSLITFQPDAAKKLRLDDITDSKIVNLVTKLLGDRGVTVAHKEKTNEHDHVYIDKLRDEFCLQWTNISASGKPEHGNKVTDNINIINKVEEVFGSKNEFECVQDVVRSYRYCEIIGYNAVLTKDPVVKNQTLYFSLQVDQDDMSPCSFAESKCLVGAVMKKGRLVNVLIRDEGSIKKISDKNFNIKMQGLFSL